MKPSSMKRLVYLLLERPWLFFWILLLSCCQVLLAVYLPVLIGQAIDQLGLADTHSLWVILQKMGVVLLLSAFLQWVLPLLVNRLVYDRMEILRQRLYEKLHSLPLSYLDGQSTGDLLTRFSSDAEQLSSGLLLILNQFFVGVLMIAATLISMFELNRRLAILVVCLTPFSFLLATIIAKKSYQSYQQQTVARGQQAQHLEEAIRQLTLLQIFQAQEVSCEQFCQKNQTYAHHSQRAIFASSTVNPTTRFVNALIYALIAAYGAWKIVNMRLTVGELTTFLQYANQYSKPFNDISSVLSELQSAQACAERIFAILDQPDQVDTSRSVVKPIRGQIEFQDVSFRYQLDKHLIEQVNLSVPAGSKVAIVGPTGAGKSTLINLLMRFYDLNSGRILLDGTDIATLNRTDFRRQVGMVLQDSWIRTGTIHENIAYACPDATRTCVEAAAQAAGAAFFIEQLPDGYDTLLQAGEKVLSQGQLQLLAIARMFVQEPSILILDEATSSIDTRTEILVQEALAKLMEQRTSFVIAHRLSTIQSADCILVMVDGRIVEQGNHDELLQKKGVYYAMNQGLDK